MRKRWFPATLVVVLLMACNGEPEVRLVEAAVPPAETHSLAEDRTAAPSIVLAVDFVGLFAFHLKDPRGTPELWALAPATNTSLPYAGHVVPRHYANLWIDNASRVTIGGTVFDHKAGPIGIAGADLSFSGPAVTTHTSLADIGTAAKLERLNEITDGTIDFPKSLELEPTLIDTTRRVAAPLEARIRLMNASNIEAKVLTCVGALNRDKKKEFSIRGVGQATALTCISRTNYEQLAEELIAFYYHSGTSVKFQILRPRDASPVDVEITGSSPIVYVLNTVDSRTKIPDYFESCVAASQAHLESFLFYFSLVKYRPAQGFYPCLRSMNGLSDTKCPLVQLN
jgi:hypothetical protein